MASGARGWRAALLGALAAVGCSSVDPDALAVPADSGAPASDGDASTPLAGTGGLPVPSVGGTGGAGAGGIGGAAGAAGTGGMASPGCVPNPDTTNEVCTEICPETCNDEDDDCDRKVDEGDADLTCDAAHGSAQCVRGMCVITACDDGWRDCDDAPETGCEASEADTDNCGVCGLRCEFLNAIPACVDGKCEPAGCIDLFDDCDADELDCETPVNTLANCGACGVPCVTLPNATVDCGTGTCSPGVCDDGFGDCDDDVTTGCEQLLDVLQHCGACNTPCDFASSTGDDCSTRVCVAGACKPGYEDCDGDKLDGCESLESAEHCGECGQTCDTSLDHVASASCATGACVLTCGTGFGDCDFLPFNGCEASIRTLQRCDECNTPCAIPHAVASCGTGTCTFVRCDPGWDDCANGPADGCEQNLESATHCGSCTNVCGAGANAGKPNCAGGVCTAANCAPDLADCNGDGTCETNTTTDEAHCGACGAACPGTAAHATSVQCVAGACVATCENLYDDCNDDVTDGCEASLESLVNCGGCGNGCSITNAMETCAGGTCAVTTCDEDTGDCDADPQTCETPLDTTQNCGACGADCNLTNAVGACGGSSGMHACEITNCTQPYFQDCDGVDATGCEADVRTNVDHCGTCGSDCETKDNVASATCAGSSCTFVCDPGFGDCNNLDADGCEQRLNTSTDCTACGMPCALANGSESCTSGACQLTGCDPAYQNCDGNAMNGCEPLNTVVDCGACGAACTIAHGTGSCASMNCAVGTCDANWDDCDGDADNGCEQDTRAPGVGGIGPCLPDPDCTKLEYDSRSYYFCTANQSWAAARDKCRQLAGTELARIDDTDEQAFVFGNLVAEAWTAANDLTMEGEWRWAEGGVDNGTQFWMGTSTGGAVGALYSNWSTGEPSDTPSPADCASIFSTTGAWADRVCADALDYVCEQVADLCPTDPAKTLPGICGCGVADTDSDSDGSANCIEACDTDPLKTAPGQCGCNVADTDSDADGVADCNDGCPSDGTKTIAPCSWAPDNYNPDLYTHTRVVNFNCGGTHQFDSTAGTWNTTCCGTCPLVSAVVAQTTGGTVSVRVLSMASLNVSSTTTLRLVGNYPVIFSVAQNATVSGTIHAGASATTPGAGGNQDCATGNGGNGGWVFNTSGGGGGGSFGTGGSQGGGDDGCFGSPDPGLAGGTHGSTTLTPLKGGCRGGAGGNSGGAGGAGGGAFQLAVQGTLTLSSTTVLSAAGGGGRLGASIGGGGGGGSGGGILINYGAGFTAAGARRVHGGAGGEGDPAAGDGENGHLSDDTRSFGGSGGSGPDGGRGATRCVGTCTTSDAASTAGTQPWSFSCVGPSGSGGGGGAGRIVATQK
jgi:hypothetical protein